MSVIFLAGVHGVGKGFLGTPVATSMGITHLTASQLIREEKSKATLGIPITLPLSMPPANRLKKSDNADITKAVIG